MLSLRTLLLILAGFSSTLMAQTNDANSWPNLRRLTPGQSIEVFDHKGTAIKGTLVSVSDESIAVNAKQGTVSVPRSEVSLVRVRSGKRRMYTLIGLTIGAGAGVGLGAVGGESLAESSGGDFANLKPAIMGASGAAGALVGAIIGSVAGNRATTVYRAK